MILAWALLSLVFVWLGITESEPLLSFLSWGGVAFSVTGAIQASGVR